MWRRPMRVALAGWALCRAQPVRVYSTLSAVPRAHTPCRDGPARLVAATAAIGHGATSHGTLACTRPCLAPAPAATHFRPFSVEDEVQLASILTTKPRHVARHIRQSMQSSRRRITQFRNAVTYLMILLQSRLQRKEMDPADATSIVESLMRECVELRQGDMAHLLFRAAIRFRKYGLHVGYTLVKHLYNSYRHDNAKELMRNMADELCREEPLRLLAVLAYQFSGDQDRAVALLHDIPRATLQPADYCALAEGFGVMGRYDKAAAIAYDAMGDHSITAAAADTRDDATVVAEPSIAARDTIVSACILAVRGDAAQLQGLLNKAIEAGVTLSEPAVGAVVRARLQDAAPGSVAEVYDVERAVREELRLTTLGMNAETAVIAKCSEVVARSHAKGDAVMLRKVQHLRTVVELAIENDQIDDLDPFYALSLLRGFGVLGQFGPMRECFAMLQRAGAVKDHRLYDEMLRWYAYSYNVKEVIALKDEMTAQNVYHTALTYYNVFRVLDRYYPRLVEKYVNEMRAKGIHVEGFMYPTLVRVFGELQDFATVDRLYREAKAKAAQGHRGAFSPGLVIQMMRTCRENKERCDQVINDAELHGLLANEAVQAEVIQLYSFSDRQAELRAFLARLPHTSPDMFRVLLRDAAHRKDRRAFQALLQDMTENRVVTNERIFSVVVTSLSFFGDAAGVRAYVHRALASDQIRTPIFFADAAAAFARLGQQDGVDQCWKDLLASKLVITMPVYNRFLDLYMTSNNLTMVQEILDTMMKLVPPNPITATTVVDMLGKMGRFAEMEAVLQEMSRSTNAAPTLVTYHQAMNAYAKSGDVTQMELMREKLQQDGFRENQVTYNILFEGYGRAKRYERLVELVAERRQKEIPMEEFGYVVLLNIYARAHMTEETEALVEELLSSGVPLTSRLLATVASSFSAVGNMPQMEHFISLLLSHPDCRPRDVESVFLIYSRLRDTVKLQELLDTEKLPKSEFVYNICVSAFARAGEHTKVAYLLKQMEAKGYTLSRNTSVTLSSLLLKAGKLELAQSVLRWKGISPSSESGVSDDAAHGATASDEGSSSSGSSSIDGSGGEAGLPHVDELAHNPVTALPQESLVDEQVKDEARHAAEAASSLPLHLTTHEQ